MKRNISFTTTIYLITFSLLIMPGCKKAIEVDAPPTSINSANVYTNDPTAVSVLTGIYANMANIGADVRGASIPAISLYAGLSADELTLFSITGDQNLNLFYGNNLNSTSNSSVGNFWGYIYPLIFTANSAIEGLTESSSLTPAVKQQLLGEAKFFRAFAYFYLVNLYGDVPLILNGDYQHNQSAARTPKDSVYKQIIGDLTAAIPLLNSSYVKSDAMTPYPAGTEQKVRPNKWAAEGLLARVYLYTGDYQNAELQASAVINSGMYSLPALANVFKMNSSETIWSLQPVRTGTQSNTGDGAIFILPTTGPVASTYPVYLSNSLISVFEANDQRFTNWVNKVTVGANTYYYAYKYKAGVANNVTTTSEYFMMMRLGEQYLIRAEARAQQNNLTGAQSDLTALRSRAGLLPVTITTQAAMLTAIQHERQVELFTELGHRWLDLKRTNTIDAVMTTAAPAKGGTWSSFKALYPIPATEISVDGNLTQNNGY